MFVKPLTLISRTALRCEKRWSSSLTDILLQVQSGQLSIDQAEQRLQTSPDEILEHFANLDHSRAKRTGFPEAVFATGKTAEQVATILDNMAQHVTEYGSHPILATRVTPALYDQIFDHPFEHGSLVYHTDARILSMTTPRTSRPSPPPPRQHSLPTIVVACAGTTDIRVAEEAAVTLEIAGCTVDRIYDVGVAGLHRVIHALPRLQKESVGCVIVCAGMDGALPSVVAGLVSAPVIAVPTSVGYGAAFGGVSALLTMLNSCAPGVGVVNIDNGFGAAALAYKCVLNAKKNQGT